MRRVEVRCCCEAGRLLGTLPVQDAHINRHRVTFPVMKAKRAFDPSAIPAMNHRPDDISLEFADLLLHGAKTRALKGDHVSLDLLRLIPGFIEARS